MRKIPLKFDIRPFEVEHAMQIELRPEESEAKQDQRMYKQFARIRSLSGPAYSFYYQDKLLFCCGMIILRPGVGSTWIVCDKAIKGFGIEVLHYSKMFVDETIKKCKLHRVQAEIKSSIRLYHQFIKRLGFQEEGTMRKYGLDGSDYILYSRR